MKLGARMAAVLAVSSFAASALGGQEPVGARANSYRDPLARRLHLAAMDARARIDDDVLRYTAVVRQRIAAALRMPLKDRTLYRSESAHRLWWDRDGENLVQLLAYREQTPAGVDRENVDLGRFDAAFDPMNDRLFFGLGGDGEDAGDAQGDGFRFEHPLYPEYVDRYWFSSADSLVLALPDGRRIVAVELQVVPRVADVHRMTGALWIEPESGALVRAVYRLSDTFDAFRDVPDLEEDDPDLRSVPGLLKPWTAEVSMISVDYSLWDFEVWLPRSMRVEGVVAAGVLQAPISLDYAYEIEAVITEAGRARGVPALPEANFRKRSEAMAYLNQLAFGEEVPFEVSHSGWNDRARDRRAASYLVPTDRAFLGTSPELPPPVWDDAAGFSSEAELEERFSRLADLPLASLPQMPTTFRWGLQRPDLVRFNRVEALSLGGRWQARPGSPAGPLTLSLTGRVGFGDLWPNVGVDVAQETLRRRVAVSGYRDLVPIDEGARHLGPGNSLLALLFGRDDGDYWYRSGASLTVQPPGAARRSYRVRGFAEYHQAANVNTSFALFQFWHDDWAYRTNIVAEEGWEYGGAVDVSPWWGTDPRMAQGGFDLHVLGATGIDDYVRASLVGRSVIPFPGRLRVLLEAGAGTSWGDPTVQRRWYVGGPRTLRGYAPRLAAGTAFARGRAEVARSFDFGALLLFGDWGWAGDRNAFDLENGFFAGGAGASLVDGLLRLDAGYGFTTPRGFRLDLYLDAAL